MIIDLEPLTKLIRYEWREEENSYGIVSYNFEASSISFTATETRPAYKPTPISPDFQSLQSHWYATIHCVTNLPDLLQEYTHANVRHSPNHLYFTNGSSVQSDETGLKNEMREPFVVPRHVSYSRT